MNTLVFINVKTGAYPLKLEDIRAEQSRTSLPQAPALQLLSDLGYETVNPTDRPVGDVYVEDTPGKSKQGKYYQRWMLSDAQSHETDTPYLNERLARYLKQLDAQRVRLLGKGFLITEGDVSVTVKLTPDTRLYMNELVQWGLLQDGDSDLTGVLPTTGSEVLVKLPMTKAIECSLNALAYVRKIEIAYWQLQRDLKAAESIYALPVIYDNSLESELGPV